jgi:hypothetical protein
LRCLLKVETEAHRAARLKAMRETQALRFLALKRDPARYEEWKRKAREAYHARCGELVHRARGHRKGLSTRGILGESPEGISIISESELREPYYIIIGKDGRLQTELWLRAGVIASRKETHHPARLEAALAFDERCRELAQHIAAAGAAAPDPDALPPDATTPERWKQTLDTTGEKA